MVSASWGFGRFWSSSPEHPRISPVETKALHDLSTVDIKYKATPVNYKNPVSSYIVRRSVDCCHHGILPCPPALRIVCC